MLYTLHISNYAIIETLEVEFTQGLNIITGETGAGKSILVGALGLILGDRADSSVLYDKGRKCIVEGVFRVEEGHPSSELLQQFDVENETEIIIRREISANGKSRGFINDTPATLVQLRDLSSLLVDLHQQFDNADAGKGDFQRSVLDVFGKNSKLLQDIQQKFRIYSSLRKELDLLEERKAEALKEQDYNQFLFDELEEISLRENELEELDEELKILSNAESIRQTLQEACYIFNEGEAPVIGQVKSIITRLQTLSSLNSKAGEISGRLQSALIELKDIYSELDDMKDRINSDPQRLEIINERIASGYRMLRKHGVTTTNELLNIRNNLEGKLRIIEHDFERSAELREQLEEVEKDCLQVSASLHKSRVKAIPVIEDKVNELLKKVGMPNARISVRLLEVALNAFGTDSIVFLFNANYIPGQPDTAFEPLHKVASGGELSRVMLILKSLVAREVSLPTLIFDEIDTGISGEASRQVAMIMKDLSKGHQVISITHQPQIAARADSHFYVYKKAGESRIITSVSRLSDDERVEAIAQMLGGDNPSQTTIRNAREMVKG